MTGTMSYVLTILATLFVWWFSTGIIVYLDGLPKRTFRWSFGIMTALLVAAMIGIATSASETSVTGAAVAFLCAILVWGWNEMGFLMGYITGPRPESCPSNAKGFDRFRFAVMALIYHEAAILTSLAAIVLLTAGQPNQFGTWTFLLLWIMRLSSKLNLFLGVPNRTEEFLPEGLTFLKSYFKHAAMNPLLPVSITAATVACVMLAQIAGASDTSAFEAVGFTLLTTLMALAILEHWLMIVPIPAEWLWGWGLKSHAASASSANEPSMSPVIAGNGKPAFVNARKSAPARF